MKNGKHLILDAYGCDYDSLWDTEHKRYITNSYQYDWTQTTI